METPVGFLIFNRPDTTEKVFEAIRKAKPPKLLVVADGPRTNRLGEAEKCAAARAIIERVDWDCEVLKNYSDVNLGVGPRVGTGMVWIFEQVEEAIILEDDCMPHPSFFPFCEELLNKYRDDERVMHISGVNLLLGYKKIEHSYYFSRQVLCWGWASWRRAFRHFDLQMMNWPEMRNGKYLDSILEDKRSVKYWSQIFEQLSGSQVPYAWDYQWLFSCWSQGGLSIIPHTNLVSNLGFGHIDATDTTSADSLYANMLTEEITFPLKHPSFMIRDKQADLLIDNTMRNPTLLTRAKAKVQRIARKNFKAWKRN